MNKPIQPPHNVSQWLEKQPTTPRVVDLSVVVPCYNEEWRIPPAIIDMIDYLDSRQLSYEIIVVDDGSTDHTVDVVKKFERIRPNITLIRVPRNYGKGHAVRLGVLSAHGKQILFADADGSTPFSELHRLEEAINAGAEIAIGSRALYSKETKVSTNWHRKVLGRAFNFCVNLLILPSFKDTQCGFKLFTACAARFLFERQESDGFSFDVEVLFLAKKASIRTSEVAINWQNVPGSKVNLVVDATKMLIDVVRFQIRHRSINSTDYTSFKTSFLES